MRDFLAGWLNLLISSDQVETVGDMEIVHSMFIFCNHEGQRDSFMFMARQGVHTGARRSFIVHTLQRKSFTV